MVLNTTQSVQSEETQEVTEKKPIDSQIHIPTDVSELNGQPSDTPINNSALEDSSSHLEEFIASDTE